MRETTDTWHPSHRLGVLGCNACGCGGKHEAHAKPCIAAPKAMSETTDLQARLREVIRRWRAEAKRYGSMSAITDTEPWEKYQLGRAASELRMRCDELEAALASSGARETPQTEDTPAP